MSGIIIGLIYLFAVGLPFWKNVIVNNGANLYSLIIISTFWILLFCKKRR